MIRKYKYTVTTLMFAILFIIGSMTAINCILRIKEKQLLTEKGRIAIESPVREWEGWKSDDENVVSVDTDNEGHFLSTKQIEEAVMSWNNRTEMILHDQIAGQISMEEAIENGEEWLVEMGIEEEIGAMSFSISAELGVGGQKEDSGGKLEAYFSFWTVTYSNQSMKAVLYLNAVTGNVWGAEIKLYEEHWEKLSNNGLQIFVKLAGLQVADDVLPKMDFQENKSEIAIKESKLYAQEFSYDMAILFENGYKSITYQLLVK